MDKARRKQLHTLEQRIGYTFTDTLLLNAALTHTSFVKGDGKGSMHNERLEFLGDAVLELIISEQLFSRYAHWGEGALTRARASIVCEPSLYAYALKFDLPDFLLLSHGEENSGGRKKPSIVSDALEALIGAIYTDGDFLCAKRFVLSFADDALNNLKFQNTSKDYKTALQEFVQKNRLGAIQYTLVCEEGPDHKKEFTMRVSIGEKISGEGKGFSKQEASQQAARAAYAAVTGVTE